MSNPAGNPTYGQYGDAPNIPLVRVMFLGGPLDHAIRLVEQDSIDPARPTHDTYLHPIPRRFGVAQRHMRQAHLTYRLIKVGAGRRSWFCYVLDGHTPRRSDLLDANPIPI